MKIYLLLLTAAAVLPPTLAMFVAYLPWDVPKDDVTHVTFPMNIANAPHERGYYFSQYYILTGQDKGNYIGLLPRPDAGPGMSVIRAAFSTFVPGSTTNDDDYCSPGADGGPGISCAVDFDGTYAHTYNLEVRNTQGTTWNGTAVDTATGRRIHIGSYTLPAGTGTTLQWHTGFVEYFVSTPPCSDLPYTSVVFGVPTTDAGVGSLRDPTEQGACAGKDNFQFKRTAENGIEISAGFPANVVNMRFQHEGYSGIGNGM
jgi:hypothetical protein